MCIFVSFVSFVVMGRDLGQSGPQSQPVAALRPLAAICHYCDQSVCWQLARQIRSPLPTIIQWTNQPTNNDNKVTKWNLKHRASKRVVSFNEMKQRNLKFIDSRRVPKEGRNNASSGLCNRVDQHHTSKHHTSIIQVSIIQVVSANPFIHLFVCTFLSGGTGKTWVLLEAASLCQHSSVSHNCVSNMAH